MELNKCLFIGNLTRDPETRNTSTGKTVTSFTIAVNSRRGQGKEETLFIKVDTWDRLAEIASQYLRKGSQVLVEGRIRLEEYTTREGERRQSLCLTADSFKMGARPREEGQQGGGSSYGGGSGYQENRAPRESYQQSSGRRGGGPAAGAAGRL